MIKCEECGEYYLGKCVKVTPEEAEAMGDFVCSGFHRHPREKVYCSGGSIGESGGIMTVFGGKRGRSGMPIGHIILTCLAQGGYRPPVSGDYLIFFRCYNKKKMYYRWRTAIVSTLIQRRQAHQLMR
jgi:hypothetical protein